MRLDIHHHKHCHHKRNVRVDFRIGPVSEQSIHVIERAILMLVLTDSQKAVLSISPVDKKEFPAAVDGVPVWTVADSTVASLTPSEDGLSASIVAEAPGTTQINVTADADLGEGVVELIGTLDVQVTAGQAVSLNISSSAPEEQ